VRILSHYFVARTLGLFATVLAAACLILSTIELVLNFDDLSMPGSSQLSTSATMHSASAPSVVSEVLGVGHALGIRLASYYMTDVIPIASFLAVFITFAWAGRAMELVGIQAGGIRLTRVILPVLVLTLILSFATAVLHETVIRRSQQISSGQGAGDHRQPEFGREAFWYHRGRTITNISFADAETRTLHGVEIFERGPKGAIARVIRAEIVQIANDGVWHLGNAAVWTFDPLDPSSATKLEKNASLTLDLDAIGGDALLHADPEHLPLAALADYLEANSENTSSSLRKLHGRYHERLASPWLVAVFGWLALPFALRVDERGRFGPPAAAAVAALSGFFLLRSAGETLAQQELIPVGLTPWLAIAIVILGSTIALRRVQF
jgi:lipopolysaccharide export LptBFGC system permease protein LptF